MKIKDSKVVTILKKPLIKSIIAAVIFHIIYSFAFGMLIGGKNPLTFLCKKDSQTLYMLLMPLFASLPYLVGGYLIILSRNSYKGLKEQNKKLFFISLITNLSVYFITLGLHFLFPYRNTYDFFILINYPAASYLSVMDCMDYGKNLLVMISAIFPPVMTYFGGLIRINSLKKGVNNGQNT